MASDEPSDVSAGGILAHGRSFHRDSWKLELSYQIAMAQTNKLRKLCTRRPWRRCCRCLEPLRPQAWPLCSLGPSAAADWQLAACGDTLVSISGLPTHRHRRHLRPGCCPTIPGARRVLVDGDGEAHVRVHLAVRRPPAAVCVEVAAACRSTQRRCGAP